MVLIFSSCLDNLEIGLANNDFKLLDSQTHNFKQQHSEFMVSTIEAFLTTNNLKLEDIKTIYFTNGPGSFTGNRLAIVFAKTLKVVNDVVVYTIDTLSSLIGNDSGVISLDAKSNKYYSATFKDGIIQEAITLTDKAVNTIEPNNNVIKNMLDKIKQATKNETLNDIKPLYVKEL